MHNAPTGTPPTGTVTFLFTDIEGSTKRWETNPPAMQAAFTRHEAILRQAIAGNGGYAYKMIGDAFQAAFPTAPQALQAAIDAQLALHSHTWPAETGEVKVRVALHTGTTEERGDDYVGPALNRVARLLSAGHGGQVLLSVVTQELVRDTLPLGVQLLDMGEHRLKDLVRPEHIFQLVAPDLPSEFPPLKTLDNRPNNLPLQPNTLIGREKEVEDVKARLLRPDVRLLTLTGPGGIGKTRLALQVAADMLDEYPDGVFFVNLAPIDNPRRVISTTAYTLGLREAGSQPIEETLKEYLQDKKLLLVLDNFEQVLDAGPSVAEVLKSAPHVEVLATSREALGLSIEHQYSAPPLPVPDPNKLPGLQALTQYDAVKLFIQRGEAVKPGFEVNNQNATAVAQICYRLEGIPLAIELAAARVKVLTPQAIMKRLGSRLKLLTGGATDLPTRQHTLRNTIEWSYDLLSEEEQKLFRRMAVFWGGRTLEAIEEVCNSGGDLELDVLDGTASLVDKSLMFMREGARGAEGAGGGGEPRFWMLETIQEFASEKLGESGEAQQMQSEHALYFMRLGEQAEGELRGANQAEWLARLEDEHDNIRAALRWAKEMGDLQALETGLRIAGASWRFWYMRGYFSEGRERLAGLLEEEEETSQAHPKAGGYKAKALNGAGGLAYLQGDYASARALYEESLALYRELGDKWGMASSLNNLGIVAQEQGDYTAARSLHEESLVLQRELGDKYGIAHALNNLGVMAHEQGDYPAARALYEESLALRRELGDKRGISTSLENLGIVAKEQGGYPAARALYEESLALSRELGDKRGISTSLGNLGIVAKEQGDYPAARALYEESLALRREIGAKRGIAECLAGLGGVAVGMGQVERGAKLLGAVAGLLQSMSAVLEREDRLPYERSVQQARTLLGGEAFEAARQEGRAMSMEQAMEYALERTPDG